MESPSGPVIEKDAVVIGAGISGLVTAKSLKEDGFEVVVLERTLDVGGLWKYREKDYGVMKFTHINVSKYNYCFSDYPFPESAPEYPHHSQMAQYIHDYADHFGLLDLIQFRVQVDNVEQIGEKWRVTCTGMQEDGKTPMPGSRLIFVCSYVAVASGHHAKAIYPTFKGQETFTGEVIHSRDFSDAATNQCTGKRVLVVGIGNSAVDVAVNCAAAGDCPSVYISTRSGAWIFSNYLMGFPSDLYVTRLFFYMPMWLRNNLMEGLVRMTQGHPRKWGLNPKMRIMETQPTVSPTLIHHLQRHNIRIAPNITRIDGSTVHFVNGSSADFDKIVYCTGYKVDLPFLSDAVRKSILSEDSNEIRLYKNVFSANIGHSLAFIGFVQPASGGLLCMSEIQGRWFSSLCKGRVKLPSKTGMEEDIKKDETEWKGRWYKSARHTIQKDPITYTDDIASIIGAKPDIFSHPRLAYRLFLNTCGAAQWRLKGPHSWSGARREVLKVPTPHFYTYATYLMGGLLAVLLYYFYKMVSSIFA